MSATGSFCWVDPMWSRYMRLVHWIIPCTLIWQHVHTFSHILIWQQSNFEGPDLAVGRACVSVKASTQRHITVLQSSPQVRKFGSRGAALNVTTIPHLSHFQTQAEPHRHDNMASWGQIWPMNQSLSITSQDILDPDSVQRKDKMLE